MADLNDYNAPTITSTRTDVQDTNRAHHSRAIRLDPGTASNRPVGAKLAELISNVFTLKSWNGTSYDTWLSISNFVRGLLGSTDAAAARATLVAVGQGDAQANTFTAFTTAGTGSAYTLNAVPDAATYAANQAFDVTFHAASSGTPTIAIDAQSAKSLMYMNSTGTKVTIGALLPANWRSRIIYDGVDFIVVSVPSFLGTQQQPAHSATPTFDCSKASIFEPAAMTANITSITLSNPVAGQSIEIRFLQDGTGGRTVALPAGSKVLGTLNTAANAVTWLSMIYSGRAARWEGNFIQVAP